MCYRRLIFTALIASFAASALAAPNYYVSDRLTIGLRGANDADAPIVKQLVSGSALSVLETEGALTKVRTEDGSVGWVDSKLLINEKPAHLMYIEASDRLIKAQETIKSLQDKNAAIPIARDESKILTDLRAELKTAQDRATELDRVARESATQLSGATARIGSLEVELTDLQSKQDRTAAGTVKTEENRGEFYPSGTAPVAAVKSTLPWVIFIVSLFLMLAIGAAAGAYAVDYYVRKRHGGFRIY